MGAFLFLVLAFQDYIVTPGNFYTFLEYRFAIALFLLACALLAHRTKKLLCHYALGYAAVVAAAATVEMMILKFGGQRSPYYAGMILVEVCVLSFMPARFSFQLITAATVYLLYALPIFFTERIASVNIFFIHNYFIVTIFAAVLVLKHYHQKLLVNGLGLQWELEKERMSSDKQFFAFMNHLPGVAFVKDVEGRYVYANEAHKRLFGTEDGYGARTPAPDGGNAAMVQGRPVAAVTSTTHGGETRYWLDYKFPIADEEGRPAKTGGLSIDITERVGTEEALKESEEKFRAISAAAADAIMEMDSKGRLAYCNPAAQRMFGYRIEELIGTDSDEILGPVREMPPGRIFEFTAYRKDGSSLPVEISTSVIQVKGKRHTVAIVRDLTERKLAQAEHAMLVEAIESTSEAVAIASAEGRIEYVNRAFEAVTGQRRDEIRGQRLEAALGRDADDKGHAVLWERLRMGQPWSGRSAFRQKDGSVLQVEDMISAVRRSTGEVVNYILIKRDITEKLRFESIAEAVNSMNNIGYIFSGIRHEIGNPVNAIKVTLNVLRTKLGSCPRQTISEYVERALGELSRLEYLLRTLKNFNMFESPVIQNVHIETFMHGFLHLVSADFDKRGIKVSALARKPAEWVQADPRSLQQVLLNILTNSADALEGNSAPEISVDVFQTGGYIRFRVTDNGAGIPEKELKEIFKPFYTTKQHGSGLGLVIAKKMVVKMRGAIEVSSKPGEGTTVDIYLPAGKAR